MKPTRQEWYDKLIKAANDGTFPSIDSLMNCRYKSECGTKKCAIGIMIPDDKYDPTWECTPVSYLPKEIWNYLPEGAKVKAKDSHCYVANQIQKIHDTIAFNNWNKEEFIRTINEIEYFKDVQRIAV